MEEESIEENNSAENGSRRSHRAFLCLTGVGGAGLGHGLLLAGCTSERQAEGGGGAASMQSPCTDLSGLTEAEKETRQTFQYVSESPKADQQCGNCLFWIPPEAGEPCGGCDVVKGPIDPEGWCISWGPQQS